jgi:hypothetical protein
MFIRTFTQAIEGLKCVPDGVIGIVDRLSVKALHQIHILLRFSANLHLSNAADHIPHQKA